MFIFIAGLAIRLIFIFTLENRFYFSDSLKYEDCALQILNGDGFGEYKREPLYPLWISFVYLFADKSIIILRLVESLMSALLGIIIFYTGRRFFSTKVGALAALLSVFYPIFIFLSGLAYPTLLGTILITLAVDFTLRIREHNRKIFSIGAGILLGLAGLAIAPTAVLVLPMIVWILLALNLPFKVRLANAVLVLGLFLLTLTPWMIRNYSYYNKFVPIRHSDKPNIVSYHLQKLENHNAIDMENPETVSVSEALGRTLKYSLQGFVHFWRLTPNQKQLISADPNYNKEIHAKDKRITESNQFSRSRIASLLSALSFGPVLFFAMIALIWHKPYRNSLLLILLVSMTLAITYSFFYVKLRYRIPIEPLLIMTASFGFVQSINFIRGLRSDQLKSAETF